MRRGGQLLRSKSGHECDDRIVPQPTDIPGSRMKTKSPIGRHSALREEDIRAYAAHLYEQSGRVPNRDIENWLEAKTCLEANVRRAAPLEPAGRGRASRRARGFTMPPSDASLWIERAEGA